MPTHRLITETHDAIGGTCDICRQGQPVWEYQGKSDVTRTVRDDNLVADSWSETKWRVCRGSSSLIEARNAMGLLQRANNTRGDLPVTRANIRFIANFLQTLIPGRTRLDGGTQ